MKSKLEIYALSVCFASVVCLVVSTGIAGYSLFEVFVPELTMRAYDYDKYQTNDSYWKSRMSCADKEKPDVRPSEEELTKQRMDAFSVEVNSEKREGFQSLIRCLMFILVSTVTLFIHWKIAQKSRAA